MKPAREPHRVYARRHPSGNKEGDIEPIGTGQGGEGDPEYRTREPNGAMMGARMRTLEVQRGMRLDDWLAAVGLGGE